MLFAIRLAEALRCALEQCGDLQLVKTTGTCQTQDPDFNMYWIEVKTGARIAVVDYAPDNLDKVEPCNDQGCGRDVVVQANKLKGRFDRVTLDDYARHWTAYWWAWLGSNQRPLGCEPNALPLSYTPHNM